MPKPADDKKFLSDITEAMQKSLAEAAADGGAAGDAVREARYAHIKPLYAGFQSPALNEDGSLVDPDAGPPKAPAAKKKAKKKKK